MKSTVESSIQAMVEKTQERQVHSTPPPTLPGATSLHLSSHHPSILQHPPPRQRSPLRFDDPRDDPVLIIMSLLQGDLTNGLSPPVAAHDEDVHQGVLGDLRGIAPAPEAHLATVTSLHEEIVRVPLLSSLPHPKDEMTDNQSRSIINHRTTPPASQLFRHRHGGKVNSPPNTTTQRIILIILSNPPAPSGNHGASGRITPRIPPPRINPHGKIPRSHPIATPPPTILPQNHSQHIPHPSQRRHATRRKSLTTPEMTNLNSQCPFPQDIC